MADKSSWFNTIWELLEAGALAESIWQRVNPTSSKARSERSHSQEPSGLSGRWGAKNERGLMKTVLKLDSPLKIRAVEWFHSVYFTGSDFFDRYRADGVFEDYSTYVCTGWATESNEYGKTTTTFRVHYPRQNANMQSGGNKNNKRRGNTSQDYFEHVREERLFSSPEDQALKFMDHLAKTLIEAKEKHKNDSDEGVGATLFAGHMLLKSYHLPRMPEPGETDWIDWVRTATEAAPQVLADVRDSIGYRADQIREDRQERNGKNLFKKIMPF